jgi:hypothetical protein
MVSIPLRKGNKEEAAPQREREREGEGEGEGESDG